MRKSSREIQVEERGDPAGLLGSVYVAL